mmetsp:Transcript_3047/g.4637  ORF Transcript_3047/g.4637 Transcript_3047/m.4637 type:complete len:495 (+) Transcript_3047:79-1563(+)
MQLPRNLPFIDWEEWMTVKNLVFDSYRLILACDDQLDAKEASSRTSNIVQAQRIVAMWRVRGKLPHSADSTAQLLEIIYRDKYQSISRCSNMELQLSYSMVIVRAVNGLVDGNQQGIYASSVLSLAEKIGLPGWIVELRHDSTHNQVPSLSVLRSAAHFLMDWYHSSYWAPQQAALEQMSMHCVLSNSTVNALEASLKDPASELLSSGTYLMEVLLPMFLAFNASLASQASSQGPGHCQVQAALRRLVSEGALLQWWRRLELLLAANACFAAALSSRLLLLAVRDTGAGDCARMSAELSLLWLRVLSVFLTCALSNAATIDARSVCEQAGYSAAVTSLVLPFMKDSLLTRRKRRRLRRLARHLAGLLPRSLGPFLHTARLKLQQLEQQQEEEDEEAAAARAEVGAAVAVLEDLVRPLQRKRPREVEEATRESSSKTRRGGEGGHASSSTSREVTRVQGGDCVWPVGLGLGLGCGEGPRLALITSLDREEDGFLG